MRFTPYAVLALAVSLSAFAFADWGPAVLRTVALGALVAAFAFVALGAVEFRAERRRPCPDCAELRADLDADLDVERERFDVLRAALVAHDHDDAALCGGCDDDPTGPLPVVEPAAPALTDTGEWFRDSYR